MNTDNILVLLAFGTFSTALVLSYLVALWTRPLFAWLLAVLGGAGAVGCLLLSEAQASDAAAGSTGAGMLILAGVVGIATIGALVGAGYGTWKARG